MDHNNRFDLVLKARYVLTLRGEEVLRDAMVGIRKGKIVYVGPPPEAYEAKEVLEGCIAMPGLVNTHTHAAMVAFRGIADDLPLKEWLMEHIFPTEAQYVTPQLIRATVPLALCEMIRSGTTTFADMYFFQWEAAPLVAEAGMRAVLAEGYADFPTPSSKGPEDALAKTEVFIQDWLGHPLISPALGPHAPYTTSPELYRKSRELAERHGVLILTHIAETRWEVEEIGRRYGKTPVRHMEAIGVLYDRVVSAHSVHLDEEEIEIFRTRGVGVAHCPESNMKLASGVAPFDTYVQRGVKIGLATDGAASNNDLDMIGEMRSAALLHKVHHLDPTRARAFDLIRAATLGGAEVLGLADRIGSIEVGKEADLILLDCRLPHGMPIYNPFSHVVYAAKATDVSATVVRGKVLYAGGEIRTLDEEGVIRAFAEAVGKILSDRGA